MKFGTTFSIKFLKDLNLDVNKSIDILNSLGFDIIRFPIYWDLVEPTKDVFNFETIDLYKLIDLTKTDLMPTLGMKSPRWPEFHIPKWVYSSIKESDKKFSSDIADKILNFLFDFYKVLFKKYNNFDFTCCIQIENEPLDPSGLNNFFIPIDILEKEVLFIKNYINKPVVLTVWGNDLKQRQKKVFKKLEKTDADILGFDYYFAVFDNNTNSLIGPKTSISYINDKILKSKKTFWITELQSEPWEQSFEKYLSKNPKSFDPDKMESFFKKALNFKVDTIFFWGVEYWIYRFIKFNDYSFLNKFKKFKSIKN